MDVDNELVANPINVVNPEEKIPVFDDDDDVIVLPQEEPIITEIGDDEEAAHAESSSATRTDETVPPETKETTTSGEPGTGVEAEGGANPPQNDPHPTDSGNLIVFIAENFENYSNQNLLKINVNHFHFHSSRA